MPFGFGGRRVEGFQFGAIHIRRKGRKKWEWFKFGWDQSNPYGRETDPKTWNSDILASGTFYGSEAEAQKWARDKWKQFQFLLKLQRALERNRITPEDYYRILARQEHEGGRCKAPHAHSAACDYHPHHPGDMEGEKWS